jgi:hypothetical protein
MAGLFRSCNYRVWALGSICVSFFLIVFFSLVWRNSQTLQFIHL